MLDLRRLRTYREVATRRSFSDAALALDYTQSSVSQQITTLEEELGVAAGTLDFVFLDHDKDAYVPDLELIVERGWLRPGAIVVADNVKSPGVPRYREYMRDHEGRDWRTTEHDTHVEYQTLIKDLVLESEYLG